MTYRALLVDWGGVLTVPLDGVMEAWARADGVDYARFEDVLRDWRELALAEAGEGPEAGPVAALERGEITPAQFEVRLADELGRRGSPVPAAGLLGRMLGGLAEPSPAMFGVVARAKESGLSTALVSNSWGNTYPRQGWDELFDAVVISGEVGMRKPEQRIFDHAADLLGVPPAQCVMVDDLPWNVEAARSAGMAAVLHTDVESTASELERLFGVPLR